MARAQPAIYRTREDNYTRCKWDAHEAERIYDAALAAYELAHAETVLAVDAARDGLGKPFYSNEKVRAAEVVVRMAAHHTTATLADAERTYKHAATAAKVAGMGNRLWMASVYRVEEDDSDLHEAD